MSSADPDPTDSAAVGAALTGWANDAFGSTVTLAEPPTAISGGFDSYLHGVRLAGDSLPDPWRQPLVVRIVPTADRADHARHEAAAQRWATSHGYAAPTVLEVFEVGGAFGLPAQVMERVPGATMADVASARPWRTLAMVDRLAELARHLHALPLDDWPGAADPQGLIDQRLSLPRRVVAELDDPHLGRALERAGSLSADELQGSTTVVCHGDFHPLNVMVDGEQAWVLDWTDAGIGPPEADVARTHLIFGVVAPIAVSSRWQRAAVQRIGPRLADRYVRAYSVDRTLDRRRLERWRALHALHGWSQVLALHAGMFRDESSSAERTADIPAGLAERLRGIVESILGAT